MESLDLLIHTQYQTTITYLKQSLKQLFHLLYQMLMHHLQLKLKFRWFQISMFTAIKTITTEEVIMEVTMGNITDTTEVYIIVMDIIMIVTTQVVITVGTMEDIMEVVIMGILTVVIVMEVVDIMGAAVITCLEALWLYLSFSLF